ncbi:hypothetical protein PG988_010849 [Apiospora saccharicola]
MATFDPFTRLVPELQLMVWKEALNNEAQARVVLVHRDSLRVIPSKRLMSQLMQVNHQARDLALRYYDIKLDVFKPTLARPIMDPQTWYWRGDGFYANRGENTPEDWEKYVRHETHQDALERLTANEDDIHTKPKGCIYLSSDIDTFSLSFRRSLPGRVSYQGPFLTPTGLGLDDSCVAALAHPKISDILDPAAPKKHLAPQRCMSAKLPLPACRLLANVVYVPPPRYDEYLKPWPGKVYYSSTAVATLWMAHIFHKMRSPATGAKYRTLDDPRTDIIKRNEWDAAVLKILQEGADSFTFREWQSEAFRLTRTDGGSGNHSPPPNLTQPPQPLPCGFFPMVPGSWGA